MSTTPGKYATRSKKSAAHFSGISGRRTKLHCMEYLEDRRLMAGDTFSSLGEDFSEHLVSHLEPQLDTQILSQAGKSVPLVGDVLAEADLFGEVAGELQELFGQLDSVEEITAEAVEETLPVQRIRSSSTATTRSPVPQASGYVLRSICPTWSTIPWMISWVWIFCHWSSPPHMEIRSIST